MSVGQAPPRKSRTSLAASAGPARRTVTPGGNADGSREGVRRSTKAPRSVAVRMRRAEAVVDAGGVAAGEIDAGARGARCRGASWIRARTPPGVARGGAHRRRRASHRCQGRELSSSARSASTSVALSTASTGTAGDAICAAPVRCSAACHAISGSASPPSRSVAKVTSLPATVI